MSAEKAPRGGEATGGLALLLAEEERLDALLTAARARGDAVIASAREEAQRLRAGLDDELAAARVDSERTASAELAHRRLALAASTAAAIERLEHLDPAQVDRLAEWLVRQAIEMGRTP